MAPQEKEDKFVPPPTEPVSPAREVAPVPAKPAEKGEVKPIAKPEAKAESRPETKPEAKPEHKQEAKPEPKPAADEAARAQNALAGKAAAGESWEVQLGAYQEPGRVKLLVGKLKELGIPTYTEKVDTPNGPRTRVRAGPFPTQDAAEKARARVKIVGVDGPVAKKQ
jgi:DedD protein